VDVRNAGSGSVNVSDVTGSRSTSARSDPVASMRTGSAAI
jgi:hypothetical protein